MNVRRFSKFLAIGLVVGVIAGWLITGDQMTIGQTNGSSWQDKTFALAQHPSSGAPFGSWLPFDFKHHAKSSLTIWDGKAYGKRALVSVCCTKGHVTVDWDGENINLYAKNTVAGNTTTVYSTRVKLVYGGAWTGTDPEGEYMITVDIGD